MSRARACVSISGDLYRRLHTECEAHGVVLASVVEAVVNRDLVAAGNDNVRASLVRRIRSTGPVSTPDSPATEVSASFKAWNRMLRLRRRFYPKLSAVRANSKIINAMLDAAGAE